MVSICEQLKLGKTIDVAITKATLMHESENDYNLENIRRTAASWMRMTDEILERWNTKEKELRKFYRNKTTELHRVRHRNTTMSETISID